MGLKQSIVVVNEYTVKTAKGGSRGGTPGNYVMRYMARDRATEDLTPVKLEDTDVYITRYMARKKACETLSSVPSIKKECVTHRVWAALHLVMVKFLCLIQKCDLQVRTFSVILITERL